jgi:hypothetical protein
MRLKNDTGKGDYTDTFSPVPHASGLRILLVDDVCMGNSYISAPSGYPEDPAYCYHLLKPLYGIPSASRHGVLGSKP